MGEPPAEEQEEQEQEQIIPQQFYLKKRIFIFPQQDYLNNKYFIFLNKHLSFTTNIYDSKTSTKIKKYFLFRINFC